MTGNINATFSRTAAKFAIFCLTILVYTSGIVDADGGSQALSYKSLGANALSTPAENAYQHLYNVMDKFNKSFDVYTDQDAGGNHFIPSGFMGDASSALIYDGGWGVNPHSGSTCIKITYTATGDSKWAGIHWQHPENNWGTMENGGYDLTGATELSFWGKGDKGGEKIEFFVGGITTGLYPDSISKTSIGLITLTNTWQKHTISLTGKNLGRIIGGFGFTATAVDNPGGMAFYLDDITYNKSRLDEPRFLVSYETLSSKDPDRRLANASFIYDNALVLLAFLARGSDEDLNRAGIIARAFVNVQKNDRSFSDGRLRNAYMSGDSIDRQTGEARLPFWWDSSARQLNEEGSQISSYTGNVAWAIIALTEYYRRKGGDEFKDSAVSLGDWIFNNTFDTKGPGGYTGGYEGGDSVQTKITWKSTEHNISVYIAFIRLLEITGDKKWQTRILHAKNFVTSMWDLAAGHFWIGTLTDGVTINKDPNTIPLDIQTWALMTMYGYNSVINWIEKSFYVEIDGFKGFDANTNKDGIWFEGTANMAIAYRIAGDVTKSDAVLEELRKAQVSAMNANGKGIVAASHDGVDTGFNWSYYSRLHAGATAWFIFAEMQVNPFQFNSNSISFSKGWNFISFPKQPSTSEIAQMPNDFLSRTRIIWSYDNQTKRWLKHIPSGIGNTLTTIESGKGYWIYMNEAYNLLMNDWSAAPYQPLSLYEGWNLFGYLGYHVDVSMALNGISDKWVIIWTWENGEWSVMHSDQTVTLPVSPLAIVYQGKAYWIKIKQGVNN